MSTCGGPCHLSSSSVPYFPLRAACLFSYRGKKLIFWNLHFFPTTTLYPFMYFHFMKLDSIILPYHMSDAHVLCTPTLVSYSNFSDHNFPCPSCLVESQMYPNVAILRANSFDELKDSRTSSPANDILSFSSHSQ